MARQLTEEERRRMAAGPRFGGAAPIIEEAPLTTPWQPPPTPTRVAPRPTPTPTPRPTPTPARAAPPPAPTPTPPLTPPQPAVPWLQPAPWEQTFLGRLFAPKISTAEQQRLQQQVTPYATQVLERAGLPTRISPTQWGGIQQAQPPMPTPPTAPPEPAREEPPAWIGAYEPPPHPGKAPEGYDWVWDSASMRYVMKARARPAPMPTGLTPAEKERFRLEQEAAEAEETRWRQQMEQQEWEREQAEATRAWQRQQAEQEQAWREQQAGVAGTQWQQQQAWQQQQWQEQLGWYQQQAMMQQQEQERQERARLGAQPMSWLQYAGYTGETPMIQPWMMPLMQGQYQMGEAIPGWTPEGGQAMPTLQTPSAQLWARMGPTAQQQFAGYRQARTGIRPEEQMFRLGAGAPPGGGFGGLRWTR